MDNKDEEEYQLEKEKEALIQDMIEEEEQIDSFIREKCIEANPNIKISHKKESRWNGKPHDKDYRNIQLADILMAIKKAINEDKISHSDGYEYIVDLCYRTQYNSWNLSLPYEQQDIEVKRFIYEILK